MKKLQIFLAFVFAFSAQADSFEEEIQASMKEAQVLETQNAEEIKTIQADAQALSEKHLEEAKEVKAQSQELIRKDLGYIQEIIKDSSKKSCKAKKGGMPFDEDQKPRENLLVFVSFSIPDESLKSYAHDAKKVGGRLVLCGLVEDSFQKTRTKLLELGVEIDIDPVLFEKRNIKHVPTIQMETESGDLDQIVGHVSLTHALGEFAESGNKKAAQALKKLRGEEQ